MLSDYDKEMGYRIDSPEVHKLEKILTKIRQLEESMSSYQKEDFFCETKNLKNAIEQGESLDELLPRAYALAITAIKKEHPKHFELRDVQVMSAIALHHGTCVELGTGEGKTVSAVLPAYLNALTGKKVHVASSNNYLSKRDFEELKPIYNLLGVNVSYVPEKLGNGTNEDILKNKKEKRDAYNADVCYASATTFIYDYLRDSITMNSDDFVLNPNLQLGFALLDDVDDILLDSAKTPFFISEQQKMYDNHMTLESLAQVVGFPKEDVYAKVKEYGMNISPLTPISFEQASFIASHGYHIELITFETKYQHYADQFVRSLLYQGDGVTEESTFYDCSQDKEKSLTIFDALKKKMIENYDLSAEERRRLDNVLNTKNLIVCSMNQGRREFTITSRGYQMLENYFFRIYLNEHRDLLATIAQKIITDDRFVLGKDYYLGEGKVLLFTENGLEKATNLSKKMQQIRNQFVETNDFVLIQQYVKTAVDVYLNYQENKDYVVVSDEKGKFNIQVITDGKIVPNRVFENGYQQAIEIKEKLKRKEKISQEMYTKSSITQKNFYSRYQKLSGMSGTSAISAFARLYDLRTVEMPRSAYYDYYSDAKQKRINSMIHSRKMKEEDQPKCPKKVMQNPELFFGEKQEKYEAIYRSITHAHTQSIKQPILITTTSSTESQQLATFLKSKGVNFQLLNSFANKEKEEEIVAKAGEYGRITISTEMAGHGMDIKLGGDREKMIDIVLSRLYKDYPDFISLSEEEKHALRKQIAEVLEAKKIILTEEKQKQIHDALSDSFGIKVICDGHFNYERMDNQVRGRIGKDGEGGEITFFTTSDDLIRMGSPKERVEDLFAKLSNGERHAIANLNKEIKRVQAENEETLVKQIEDANELNSIIMKYCNRLRKQRSEFILGQEKIDRSYTQTTIDYAEEVENLLDTLIQNIIISNIPDGMNHKSFSFSPKEAEIDVNGLVLDLEVCLGIVVSPESIYQFETLKEIKDVITHQIQWYHHQLVVNDSEKQREIDRSIMICYIDNILNVILNDMELQKRIGRIVSYEGKKTFFDTYRKLIENESLRETIRLEYGRQLTGEKATQYAQLEKLRNDKLQMEFSIPVENDTKEKLEQSKVENVEIPATSQNQEEKHLENSEDTSSSELTNPSVEDEVVESLDKEENPLPAPAEVSNNVEQLQEKKESIQVTTGTKNLKVNYDKAFSVLGTKYAIVKGVNHFFISAIEAIDETSKVEKKHK